MMLSLCLMELVTSVCRLGQSETNSVNRVRLVKNTNIPPRTRITCVTKLEHEVNGDVMIQGLRHPSGLLMPNSLVLAEKHINVQVFNYGSESVLLRAGEVIGIASQLDDEDKLNGNIRKVQTATNDL